MFSMKNKGFCEVHTAAFLYLRGPYKKDDKKVFRSTTVKDSKLKGSRFRLDIKKKFFYDKIGETLESVSQSEQLCVGLSYHLGLNCDIVLGLKLDSMILKFFSNLDDSTILCSYKNEDLNFSAVDLTICMCQEKRLLFFQAVFA